MPRVMPGKLGLSFSGLYSAAERQVQQIKDREGELSDKVRAVIAAKFQEAAIGQLEEKLVLALKSLRERGIYPNAVVASSGSGMASDLYLRNRFVPPFGSFFTPGRRTVSDWLLLLLLSRYRSSNPHSSCDDRMGGDETVPIWTERRIRRETYCRVGDRQ
ncbi:hypothetical protein DACRYDRAFT_108926 [Dacryopinax primogenitus]|uniref:Uncharacterized protein n=1 Tax=Dacryopinax primogenitus (strain DJM 731) TaxID=1858805 RepID=M5FS64_DACPD|nr:uncharacterized protein DACRYDRAFT_108926 [Dacryopinax primogenitus]EJU00176.1 hypothetical protein DACRYDRAFT_108926 [Dacryopinax primogenitus]